MAKERIDFVTQKFKIFTGIKACEFCELAVSNNF